MYRGLIFAILLIFMGAAYGKEPGVPVQILSIDGKGIPVALYSPIDRYHHYPKGMFCLPKFRTGDSCSSNVRISWQGLEADEATTVFVGHVDQKTVVLTILKDIGLDPLEKNPLAVYSCSYDRAERKTTSCRDVTPQE